MSVIAEIDSGSPPAADAPSGDGWEAALCIAWAQIVEGPAVCDHCGEPATVVLATGPDPDYAPLCWESARMMILASTDLGDQLFGGSG
jgi:hypothetical protein